MKISGRNKSKVHRIERQLLSNKIRLSFEQQFHVVSTLNVYDVFQPTSQTTDWLEWEIRKKRMSPKLNLICFCAFFFSFFWCWFFLFCCFSSVSTRWGKWEKINEIIEKRAVLVHKSGNVIMREIVQEDRGFLVKKKKIIEKNNWKHAIMSWIWFLQNKFD